MDEVYGQIREIIGYDINPGSSNEVAKYLKGQGVRLIYTADGAPSVTGEFLEELGMPVANLISEWRDNRKIKNTFLESYVLKSNIRGKIYGTFKPMQAKTGRMAAESPNLQNLPSRDALAKKVRKVFIPDVGHRIWVKGDYSSIEYRGLAHFATGEGSDALRRQYHNDPNTDYHKFTIEMIAKLTGQTLGRPHVKQVNFSILYGAQIKKLAAILGMDLKAAAALMQAYHAGLPYVNSTMAWASNLVHTVGHSETIMGRRVYFDTWEPQYRERGQYTPPLPYNEALCSYGANIKRSMAYRALNYVIQGTAAEVLKAGQVACYQAGLYDILGPPRMYVHDETDFSLPDMTPEIMEALAEVKHLMENAIPLKVPVKVDFEYGPNWSELYNLDLS